MDAHRLARYQDKLDHASEALDHFQRWAEDARTSLRDRKAAYKVLQEAGEAMMDITAMAIKDLGRPPKDDYTNIDLAEREGLFSSRAAGGLRELNGLRNRLVHEYDALDDEIALSSGIRLVPEITQAMEEVRAWLS